MFLFESTALFQSQSVSYKATFSGTLLSFITSFLNSMFSKLKQIKDLRSQAKSLQGKLAQETVHASAKGGKINVVMDGNQKIVALEIDPSLLTPEQKKDVEDGIKEAIEEALKKVQRIMVEKMRSSGMSLPGME